MINFTSIWRPRLKRFSVAMGMMLIVFLWFNLIGDLSADAPAAELEDGFSPDANLKYLFAVYSVSGGAFFLYLFFLTKKVRELKAEIEHLKTLDITLKD